MTPQAIAERPPQAASDVRARIGFTCVSYVNEVVPRVFYEMVPAGVVISTLHVQARKATAEERQSLMQRLQDETLSHARSFARAGCDVVFLGGTPTNLSRGWDHLVRVLSELEQEFGVPVTSSATAQNKAMLALGAKRVGVVHPLGNKLNGRHDDQLRGSGLIPTGCIGAEAVHEDFHLIPKSRAYELGAALKRQNPQLDTILFGCPHWYVADAIEPLERDFGVNVVTALQAVVWEGLRRAGIDDRVKGYGRLLRDY